MVQISFLIYLRDPIPAPHRFLSFIHHIHFEIRVLSVSHTIGVELELNTLLPSDTKCDTDRVQYWRRWWLLAWRHQAITWTNVDLSSVRSCGIHLRALSKDLKIPNTKTRSKITFLRSTFPKGQWVNRWATECPWWVFWRNDRILTSSIDCIYVRKWWMR